MVSALKNLTVWEFPGDPMVRTQRFHCCGPGSIPGQGTKILQASQHGVEAGGSLQFTLEKRQMITSIYHMLALPGTVLSTSQTLTLLFFTTYPMVGSIWIPPFYREVN